MSGVKNEIAAEFSSEATHEISAISKYLQGNFPTLIAFSIKIILAIVVFLIARIIIRWVDKLVKAALKKSSVESGIEQFISSLIKFVLYAMLLILLITNLGVETTSVAALVASGGVAVGLALQGSLSNVAGGVLILLLKPFSVGDYIIEDGNQNEGTVKEIQLFYTKLLTIDNKTVVIPNGSLANTSLTNVTARNYRQLDLHIFIPYSADLIKIKNLIQQVLKENTYILQNEPQNVFVSDLKENMVVVGVRAWSKTEAFGDARAAVLETIKLKLDEEGVNISSIMPMNTTLIFDKKL